jgi:MFS family permease
MALATVSILACCVPVSVTWFFLWRLVSGLAGGVIMVRVAGAVLPYLPDRRRGLAGGAVFLGLGLGIAATGTLIPLLLGSGLRATWIGLAVLCAVLTAFSWKGWPTPVRTDSPAPRAARPQTPAHKDSGSLKLGIVPVFLGRVQQLVPRPEAQAPAWGKATIVSALFLALASYGFSYLFGQSGGDHRLLFTIGICAVVGGLLSDAASHLVRSGPARESGPSVEARDAGHAVKLLKP